MAEGRYEIAIDKDRKLFRLTLFGLWDMPLLNRFRLEQAKAFDELLSSSTRVGEGLILVDLREHLVQAQEVSKEFGAITSEYGTKVARVAVIVSQSALQHMQTRRVASAVPHRIFTSEEEAMARLFG